MKLKISEQGPFLSGPLSTLAPAWNPVTVFPPLMRVRADAMSQPANILQLRELLAQRFPHAHAARPPVPARTWATGVASLDAELQGGWPMGELSELVGAGDGSGSAQLLHALLQRTTAEGRFVALVDGADSFDADAAEATTLARLLWVRCDTAETTLAAADLLLRDRNFPFVIVDLKLNPPAQLRKISGSIWHRFHRLTESNGTTVLVITPTPLVSGAACRVRVENQLPAGVFSRRPSEVLAGLRFEILRSAETGRDLAAPRAAQAG